MNTFSISYYYYLYFILIGLFAFKALGDGFRDKYVYLKKKKKIYTYLAHAMPILTTIVFLVAVFSPQVIEQCISSLPIWNWIVVYLFTRFALYNPLYNIARGNNILYTGTNSLLDKIENWLLFSTKTPRSLFLMLRIFFLTVSIGIINNLWM